MPEGPTLTYDEQRLQTHLRAERGTSCWLAGECKDSNTCRCDKTLAPQVRSGSQGGTRVSASSIWVTVQRRRIAIPSLKLAILGDQAASFCSNRKFLAKAFPLASNKWQACRGAIRLTWSLARAVMSAGTLAVTPSEAPLVSAYK